MPNATYINMVVNRHPFGWRYVEPGSVFHFDFEEIDPYFWKEFVERNAIFAAYAGVTYILVIFGLQAWMRNRRAYSLRLPLFLWNLGLGLFSIVGFVRYVPGFMFMLKQPNGFYNSICVKKDTSIPVGFWTLAFVLSKYVELGDTVFIVLRKKPLILLQWYHHVVTMSVTWIVGPFMEPVSRWYTFLNYFVHSLMYPYFTLKTINVRIPVLISNLITSIQLVQMIIGLFVNVLSMYYQQTGHDCFRHPTSIKVFCFVYGSFVILFGKLFFDAVIRKQRSKKKSQ